jgi:hypothetical protein
VEIVPVAGEGFEVEGVVVLGSVDGERVCYSRASVQIEEGD